MMSLVTRTRKLTPGLLVLLGTAVFARGFADLVPAMSPLIIAIGCGALAANLTGVPDWVQPGLNKHKTLLETGIVLLGVRLTIDQIVETGPIVALLAAGMVGFGILYMEGIVSRFFDVGRRTTSLLAAGASVCGVSAILAVAGSIDVDETDITYAVATILLFDAITLVVFPLVGELLHISGKQFGIWAGLSLFSTGPTAAVGFAVSETAGKWATITKLARNTFIGVIVVGYALRYATAETGKLNAAQIWERFPKFLIGFSVVVLIANLTEISTGAVASIGTIRDWLFLLAFVGLGFDINLDELRATGLKPVLLVLVHLVTVSAITLALVLSLF